MVVRLRDSYVSPEWTLDLPEAVRECCCFQGLTRPFLGGPALLGAQQWLNLTHPRHFAAPETLWLTARTTPVDVVTLAARASAFRGRKRAVIEGCSWGHKQDPTRSLPSHCPHCNWSKLGRNHKLLPSSFHCQLQTNPEPWKRSDDTFHLLKVPLKKSWGSSLVSSKSRTHTSHG